MISDQSLLLSTIVLNDNYVYMCIFTYNYFFLISYLNDKECRKAIENITTNYPKLTRSLPIDDLIPDLFSKKVISGVQKENIQKEKLKKGKVSFLFDEVIIPGLQSGTSTKYNNLIKVMDASDDTTANRLAGILKGKFIATYMYAYARIYIVACTCTDA